MPKKEEPTKKHLNRSSEMKPIFTFLLFFTISGKAQDTLKIPCSQQKITSLLLEKGYSIDTKTDYLIVTNGITAYKNNSFKIVVRLRLSFNNSNCYLIGESTHNYRSKPTNRKIDWVGVENNGKNQNAWEIINDFAKYASK